MSVIIEPAAGSGLRHALTLPLEDVEWRESGNGNDYTLRGHAAVFNKLSDDLGGFRELLEPRAFRAALRKNPDVRLLLNHDVNYVMARTASRTLELREDKTGLHVWARASKRMQWVSDLRESMLRGDVDQMSFAFTVADGGDDWAVAEDGTVVRTIRSDGVGELFDVSVVTFPAYPQTDAAMRSLFADAKRRGLIPGLRADVTALDSLVEAYQAVQEFMQVENAVDDADDLTKAQEILDALDGLIQVEAAEPDDGAVDADEQDGRARLLAGLKKRVAPVRVGRPEASRSATAGAARQARRDELVRAVRRSRLDEADALKET